MSDLILLNDYCNITKTSLTFKRDVSEKEWQKIFTICKQIEGCIQFWIGDLLKYREQRWGMYDDIAEKTGYEIETLRKYKKVSERIENGLRRPELNFSHHEQVAFLDKDQQAEILQQADENKWTVKETKEAVKKIKNVETQEKILKLEKGKYNIIYADPPWEYRDKQDNPNLGGAIKHYPIMSDEEIYNLPIQNLYTNDCVLFLWTTSPKLKEGLLTVEAWGFEYKASFIWDKVKHTMGHYNSVRHEILLIGGKGICVPQVKKLFDSVQSIERSNKHSEKPEQFRKIIDTLYPTGNRIELFARKKIENWDVWGNEI